MPIFYRLFVTVLTCLAALPAHAGEPQRGIAGVAGRKATVNFTDLARQEARVPLAARTPKVIHSPMPDHGNRRTGVTFAGFEGCSAGRGRPRAAFARPGEQLSGLGDDTTAIPPDTHGR